MHKNTILMKLFIITLISALSLSFNYKDIDDDIIIALQKGNSIELAKHFAEKLSVKIINDEDLLSKSQAQAMINDFFINHKVKTYHNSHYSIVNGDQQFMIGTLETNNGLYRISILIRGNVISQFRIENNND